MTSNVPQQRPITYVNQNYVIDAAAVAPFVGGERYAKQFYGLGITQLIVSIISVILGVFLLVYAIVFQDSYYDERYQEYFFFRDTLGVIGTGIWCGVFFFVSGLLGVLTSKRKTKGLVTGSLVMSVFSMIFAITFFGLEITAALVAANYATDYGQAFYKDWNNVCGVHSTLAVIAFAEIGVSIAHLIYCCAAQCSCCQNTPTGSNVTYPAAYGHGNPIAVQVPAVGQPPAYTTGAVNPGFVSGTPFHQQIVTTGLPPPVMSYQVQPALVNSAQAAPSGQMQVQAPARSEPNVSEL